MDQSSAEPRRKTPSPFEVYLRTGRRVSTQRRHPVEVKFNHWHDAANGRFAFAGQGRYVGVPGARKRTTSGAHSAGSPRSPVYDLHPSYRQFDPKDPRNHTIHVVKRGDTLSGIARLRKGVTVADLAWLNGMSAAAPLKIGQKLMLPTQVYLDAGRDAKNRFVALDLYMETHGGKLPLDAAHPPSIDVQINNPAQWHVISKNGYRFVRDLAERTREIKGEISINVTAKRSRRNQREAGGADRRPTDDGGHYIAVRFNGPSDAFNHFAQDANFNRGAYRALENRWATSVRGGHHVSVDIVPHYHGLSLRPDRIAVTWTVDGEEHGRTFTNEKGSKHRGER